MQRTYSKHAPPPSGSDEETSYPLEVPGDMQAVCPVCHKSLVKRYKGGGGGGGELGAAAQVMGEVKKIYGHKTIREDK